MLRACQGKGGKDRYAILSQNLLVELPQSHRGRGALPYSRPGLPLERCDSCGFERPAYNSCRNRHCPKCQSLAKLKWLEKQKSEILPVGYFHLVLTLSHELNKKILLSHLFKAVGETLVDFGSTGLGGQIGFITVRHTWDQTLLDHFHLHCLVPAGALSFEQKRWTPARKNFLFPVKALSIVFRGKFLDFLKGLRSKQAALCRSNRFPG
jgi:Transposase zinc-binding domain/Putative transposase